VHQLHGEGELDRVGRGRLVHRAPAGEQRQGTEVLGRTGERPRQRRAQLVIDPVKPRRHPSAEIGDVGVGAERDDHLVGEQIADRLGVHGLTR
jgi:hypothetical protein